MKFKAGDWVRHKQNSSIIDCVESLDEEAKTFACRWSWASSEDDFELWKPKEGEIIVRKFGKNKAIIMRYTTCEKEIGKNPIVEPFIGTLPSFIKESNES